MAADVEEWLVSEDIFIDRALASVALDAYVKLTFEEIVRIGALVEREKDIGARFETEITRGPRPG